MEDLDWTCCRTTDIFYKVHWVREEAKSLVHVAVHRTSATALPWTRRQRSPHRIFQFNQLPRYARCFPNDLRWRPRRLRDQNCFTDNVCESDPPGETIRYQ